MAQGLRSADVERGEISVTVGDDALLAELHERYLGLSGPTDVLAFSLDGGPLVSGLVGDIYVSVDRAEAQAEERGIALGEEVLRLAVHGALHLAGYQDDTPRARGEMERRQEKLVAEFGGGFDAA